MDRTVVLRISIISIFLIAYILFTKRAHKKLKENILLKGGILSFHLVMIWLVPFVWALLINALSKRTPGSYEIPEKEDPTPFSNTGGKFWSH